MKAKLIVSENWMVGCQHLGVNLGLIEIFKNIFPDNEVHYYGEARQNELLKKTLPDVNYHSVRFLKYRIWILPFFDMYSTINLLRVLFLSKKDDKILITNKLVIAHIIYNFCNRFLKRSTYMVLHSEIEALVNPKSVGMTKYYMYFHKVGFELSGKHTQYIVLGESIKSHIVQFNILNSSKILCIDHPYDYEYEPIIKEIKYPIKLGTIGRALRIKRSDLIFQLSDLLKNEIQEGLLTLEIVGSLEPAIIRPKGTLVSCPYCGNMIDRDEFQKRISDLDYVLCFLDASTYMCTPSGTVFDAIKFNKPTLMISGNTFMDYYSERFPGISQGFPSVNEMTNYIRQIVREDIESLCAIRDSQYKALKSAKQSLLVSSIVENLRLQMESLDIKKGL